MTQNSIAPPQLNLPTKRVDGYDVPILDRPYTQILEAIERGAALDMDRWHGETYSDEELTPEMFCGTTHCLAGWTVHLCGVQGFALEQELAVPRLASMILEASSTLEVPGFYPDDYDYERRRVFSSTEINARALAAIRERAAVEVQS